MLKRIITPLDGSELSHAALPLTRWLAEATGAGVTLVSVMDPPRDFYIAPQGPSHTRLRPKDVDHLASEEKRLQEYLNNIKTSFDGIRVSTDIRLGEAAEEILNAAESSTGSAIVLASHGRSGLGRALLGSVAGRIVQTARQPVFVVRATEDSKSEFGKQRIGHVVVALDGSRMAEQALDRAYSIFGNDVRYTLVRCVEPIAPGQAYTSDAIADYERQARSHAEDYLLQKSEELIARGATVSADVRIMLPASGIMRVAEEVGGNLIVMSTHGRTGFGRFLMGSVAERVLHNAEQPLMIVRGSEPER
jgi:nucleotide-binding universal stress UspA family protein